MSLFSPELKHHSPSSINSFIEYRTSWFLQRIQNKWTKAGVHAARGTAVEAGINYWLSNEDCTKEDAIKEALEVFTKESLHLSDTFSIRQTIAPCVVATMDSFEEKGYTFGAELQKEIRTRLKGCNKDIIGKLDYFIDGNRVIDTKVVSKTPSSLKQGYILQGSIYRLATGLPVYFHFAVPLKTKIVIKEIMLTDEDYKYGIQLATVAARHIERIFDNLDCLDGDLLKSMFFVNPTSLFSADDKKLMGDEFGLTIPQWKPEED